LCSENACQVSGTRISLVSMANKKRNSANIPSDRSIYEEMAEELDELAMVPTDVLAAWVTDRGRCLWETTFGDPPEWTGEDEPDRELATRMCAGCPVRAECLEFELRIGDAETVGVWGALNEDDGARCARCGRGGTASCWRPCPMRRSGDGRG
jgi:WhiB family transcriptional regulator, redox-sensing transcriptional regulator